MASQTLDMEAWRSAVTRRIFNVTLDAVEAEKSAWTTVYLKELSQEIRSEGQSEEQSC